MSAEAREHDPDVTVVIPCRDGAKTLGRQLDALRSQSTSARFEVVVADNGSTDDSRAVVQRYGAPFRVVDASGVPGINHARNTGVGASRARLVLFCDADDVVHESWVESYWQTFCAGASLMGGPVRRVAVPYDSDGEWQRGFNDWLGFLPWPTGANCGFSRSVVDDVGPLDEDYLGGGDETDFFWRAQLAGHRLTLVESAGIDYVRRPSRHGIYVQNRAYGLSHAKLYQRFKAQGMPKPSITQPLVAAGRVALSGLRSGWSADKSRAVVACVGQCAGRSRAWRRRTDRTA